MSEAAENPLRKWRNDKGLSLEAMCELFAERGFEKPSTAKLSRIERDQNVPLKMIAAVEAIMGIPAKEQRPDLAKILDGAPQ
jgi:transcriptional regulator with XRE-family HTH domain